MPEIRWVVEKDSGIQGNHKWGNSPEKRNVILLLLYNSDKHPKTAGDIHAAGGWHGRQSTSVCWIRSWCCLLPTFFCLLPAGGPASPHPHPGQILSVCHSSPLGIQQRPPSPFQLLCLSHPAPSLPFRSPGHPSSPTCGQHLLTASDHAHFATFEKPAGLHCPVPHTWTLQISLQFPECVFPLSSGIVSIFRKLFRAPRDLNPRFVLKYTCTHTHAHTYTYLLTQT